MSLCYFYLLVLFFCKQKTSYEIRISDWSSYVCSSDLPKRGAILALGIPVGIVVAFLITSVIAWIYLGLPSAKFDIFKMPGFFWYYRHDPVVLKALAEIGRASCRGRVCKDV